MNRYPIPQPFLRCPWFKPPSKLMGGFSFAVPGLELRAFTLSHSTNPTFVKGFSR
jgi:hypothetical protein